jgi:hypothetical protein
LASYTFTVSGARNLIANFTSTPPPTNHPPVITGLSVSNAWLQAGSVVVAEADLPVYFTATATDVDGNLLSYLWTFCDGATNGQAAVHAWDQCDPCPVSLAVSDGPATTMTNLTLAGHCDLNVTNKGAKAQAKLSFAKPDGDSFALAVLADLGAEFNPAGQPVTVNFGGAELTFVLDDKGKGVNYPNSCSLKFSSTTGLWAFKVKTKSGDWQTAWAEYEMTNETVAKPGRAVSVPVVVVIGTKAFTADISMLYTATAGKSGQAK